MRRARDARAREDVGHERRKHEAEHLGNPRGDQPEAATRPLGRHAFAVRELRQEIPAA